MNFQEKKEKLKKFQNEAKFREFLIDFLKKSGFKNVIHTHRHGSPEQGKDIIAKLEHPIDSDDWYAFVVKVGRIGGGTNEIETIKNQIKQAFEYPYVGPDGKRLKINKVKVITNENFTGGAQSQLANSTELQLLNNVDYWWNETLIPLIDKNFHDFWLPGDSFSKEYSKVFRSKLEEEIAIKELSVRRIDDKKIKKLLEIFVEPKLSTSIVEIDPKTKEKSIKQKNINVNAIDSIEENLLLSGDQGSGKSKILNTIACKLADPVIISNTRKIPVRIKAPDFRDEKFNIEQSVINNIKSLIPDYYKNEITVKYTPVLFIDDIDLLNKIEKENLIEQIKEFCADNNTYYVLTYRKNEFDYDNDIRSITIHNFNLKQIESFVVKFFEGTNRGTHFIKILKESDILSRLPTTPLTITLLSLLYDENNYEIPATLSDIYTDFTNVLLGKLEIVDKKGLLIFNMKRRIFTTLALKMLIEKEFEISLYDFENLINDFLKSRGYKEQNKNEIYEIIEKSGLLYIDDSNYVGFKQQAFVEFLASLEIYHHSREKHYEKLINYFNDVNWQNTAIFYAGHSKELTGMIDDVVEKSPNETLKDWFINSSGMGYLGQALYQTTPYERKKLVHKSLDNLIKAFFEMKRTSSDKNSHLFEISMPLLVGMVNFWFNENFKSITLDITLEEAFDDIYELEENFNNNYKLLMLSSTLMNPYIGNENPFAKLIERESFMKHPILSLAADMVIEIGIVEKKNIPKEHKNKIKKSLVKKREYIKSVLKEPAYRFNDEFKLE